MLIRCPECAHTRQINETQIPAGSEFATCPKCHYRFRFRTVTAAEQIEPADKSTFAPDHIKTEAPAKAEPTVKTEVLDPVTDDTVTDKADKSSQDVWSAVEDLNDRWERDRQNKLKDSGQNDQYEQDELEKQEEPDKQDDPDSRDRTGKPEKYDEPGEISKDNVKKPVRTPFKIADFKGGQKPRQTRQPLNSKAGRYAEPQEGRPGFLANSGSVPWEYTGGFLHPVGLARTIVLAFTRSAEFFSGISPRGSLVPALVFALLMRGLQFAITFAVITWEVTTPQGEQVRLTLAEITKVSMPELIVTTLFIVVFLQFISAFIINFMVRLVEPARPRFNITFKVLAYALAPLVFIVLPQIGILLAEIGSLLLLTIGLRHAYKLNWHKTLTVMLPLILLMVLLSMNSLRMLS